MATPRRTGLGRGIGALIPTVDDAAAARPVDVFFPDNRPVAEELVTVPGARLANLSPADIVPNAQQPSRARRSMNSSWVSVVCAPPCSWVSIPSPR
jgi:hypothetical protein